MKQIGKLVFEIEEGEQGAAFVLKGTRPAGSQVMRSPFFDPETEEIIAWISINTRVTQGEAITVRHFAFETGAPVPDGFIYLNSISLEGTWYHLWYSTV